MKHPGFSASARLTLKFVSDCEGKGVSSGIGCVLMSLDAKCFQPGFKNLHQGGKYCCRGLIKHGSAVAVCAQSAAGDMIYLTVTIKKYTSSLSCMLIIISSCSFLLHYDNLMPL